jgi:alpha-ketoglutarate-dependent taurine dioxygenase
MTLRTRPLHEHFGQEVLDVDLARTDDATLKAIYALWQRDPLLLFRRQSLTEEELVAYSQFFGDLELTARTDAHSPRNPRVSYISALKRQDGSSLGALGNAELLWHTDQIYRQRPATGSIFHGTEMPQGTGRTSWCNMVLAYRALPEGLRAEVDRRQAHCKYGQKKMASFQALLDQEKVREIDALTPPVEHEMSLDVPATGERTLYISPNHTFAIEGMGEAEGRTFFDSLLRHAIREEFIYHHDWRNGDVMMWDNGRLLHRREPVDETLPRFARRTTVFLRPEDFAVPR